MDVMVKYNKFHTTLSAIAAFVAKVMAIAWFVVMFWLIVYKIFIDSSYKIQENQLIHLGLFTIVSWVSLSLTDETQENDTRISMRTQARYMTETTCHQKAIPATALKTGSSRSTARSRKHSWTSWSNTTSSTRCYQK